VSAGAADTVASALVAASPLFPVPQPATAIVMATPAATAAVPPLRPKGK
jgi:hypothetical protein